MNWKAMFPPIFRSDRAFPGLTSKIQGTNVFVLLQQSNKEFKKKMGEKMGKKIPPN